MIELFVKYLQNILKGRGVFASFLVISGWLAVIIILIVLIYYIFVFLIKKIRQNG